MSRGIRRVLVIATASVAVLAAVALLLLRSGRPLFYTDGDRQLAANELIDAPMLVWSAPEPEAELPGPVQGRAQPLPDGRLLYARDQPDGGTDLVLFDPRRPQLPPERAVGLDGPGHELAPALGADGFLYFASDRPGGAGGFDLYRARYVDGVFGPVAPLRDGINGPLDESDPAPDPRGGGLVFVRRDPGVADGHNGALWQARLDGSDDATRLFDDLATRADRIDRDPAFGPRGVCLWWVRQQVGGEPVLLRAWRLQDRFAAPVVEPRLGHGRGPVPSDDGFALDLLRNDAETGNALLYRALAHEVFPWWAGQAGLELALLVALLISVVLLALLLLGERWRQLDVVTWCLLFSLFFHLLLLLLFTDVEIVRHFFSEEPSDREGIEVELVSERANGAAAPAELTAQGYQPEQAVQYRMAPRSLEAAAPSAALAAATTAAVRPPDAPTASERDDLRAAAEVADAASLELREGDDAQATLAAAATTPAVAAPSAASPRRQPSSASTMVPVTAPGTALAGTARGEQAPRSSPDAMEAQALAAAPAPAVADAAAAIVARAGTDAAVALTGQAPALQAATPPSMAPERSSAPSSASAAEPAAAVGLSLPAAAGAPAIARDDASARELAVATGLRDAAAGVPVRVAGAAPTPVRASEVAPLRPAPVAVATAEAAPAQPHAAAPAPTPAGSELMATVGPRAPAESARAVPMPQARMPEPIPVHDAAFPAARPVASQEPVRPQLAAAAAQLARDDPVASAPPTSAAPSIVPEGLPEATAPGSEMLAVGTRPSVSEARPSPARSSLPSAAVTLHDRPASEERVAGGAAPEPSALPPSPSVVASEVGAMPADVRLPPPPIAPPHGGPSAPATELADVGTLAPPRVHEPTRAAPRAMAAAEPVMRDAVAAVASPSPAHPGSSGAALRPVEAALQPAAVAMPEAPVLPAPASSPVEARGLEIPGSLLARADRRRVAAAHHDDTELPDRFRNRSGSAKAIALRTYGGSAETERAVRDGLAYLARIQNADGSWGPAGYRDAKYGEVRIGKTGLCLLAFLGAGHTQTGATEHRDVVERAIGFLLGAQDPDSGAFGITSSYSQGVATYALAECLGMTRDPRLRRPVSAAVSWILANQNHSGDRRNAGGWGYFSTTLRPEDGFSRSSITVWMVMALESARLAGLQVPADSITEARAFLRSMWDGDRDFFYYNHDPARTRSVWPTLPASTPAAVFALLLLGDDPADADIRGGLRFTVDRRPRSYHVASDDAFVRRADGHVYFWYYGSLACFLAGGDVWATWNDALKRVLPSAQDADGSWAPIDAYAKIAHDQQGDRSYTTAMCVLSLEVYYRYFTPLLRGR